MAPRLRKTRFVCVSDTHNASPADGSFKLPKCDVLIHAGDLTKQGTYQELERTLNWINEADAEVKLVVAGNHDITLDPDFYNKHSFSFHNQHPQDPQRCLDLVNSYDSIMFLSHTFVEIRLARQNGPQTSFRAFGSPYSPRKGLWAFGYAPERPPNLWECASHDAEQLATERTATSLWDEIPLSSDVVITHTPPNLHCDSVDHRGSSGCESLRRALWRIRPSLAICGHIHEGRGAEWVSWDLSTPNAKYKENAIVRWTDPGLNNKKQSLLDLSSKSADPLQNTGPWEPSRDVTHIGERIEISEDLPRAPPECHHANTPSSQPVLEQVYPAARGQGGAPPSGRCDMEALAGRMGRKETCIVNAAIMATSWPYKKGGGSKFNKPVVVDIDLSVWKSETSNEGQLGDYKAVG